MTTPRDDDRTEALPTHPVPDGPPVGGPHAVEPSVIGVPEPAPPVKIKRTRISGTWVAVLASIVVLIFLLVFILQNLTGATIHFLGAAGTLPLGVALLFAAIAGAILVALVGAARIMQLRRQAKRGLR
ncbi:lipopolysaccharide assembly protein LapA domain-containing protein [Actinosynnema sp. NPDC053489]|uniref:LapA family protein n=1 Tax=Actinosynnema sp. NPDC053489 TaxID=3363916 RepID=UPI0037C8FE9C